MTPKMKLRMRNGVVHREREGQWVPMQAMAPLTEAGWTSASADTKAQLLVQRRVKTNWEQGQGF